MKLKNIFICSGFVKVGGEGSWCKCAYVCVWRCGGVENNGWWGGVAPYDVCLMLLQYTQPIRYTSIEKRQVAIASSPIPSPTGGRRALAWGKLTLLFTLHTIVMKNYHGKMH